jgi:hypothetical protein
MIKISVILAIRDGEKYIAFLNNVFDKIESLNQNQNQNQNQKQNSTDYDYEFEYFIYENNSIDNTKEQIKDFYKKKERKGKYFLESIDNNTVKTGINFERGAHMANLRNKLKDFHGQLVSDYVLLLDCDAVFTANTIEQLINTMNDKIVMTSPFCISWKQFLYDKCVHYYDTFAVITKEGLTYKNTYNSCLFKSCILCSNFRKNNNINIDEQYLFSCDKLIEVKSAFGSISLIKTNVYNNVKWESTICEHHSFCEQINKYGSIVINPQIKSFTTEPTLTNYNEIEKELINIEFFLYNNK